jgi:hypothetical protein
MKKIFSMLVLLGITLFGPKGVNCQRVTIYQNDAKASLQKRSRVIYGYGSSFDDIFCRPGKFSLSQVTIKKVYLQDITSSGIQSEKILEKTSGKALTYEEAICFINTVTASFSDDWYDGCGITFVMDYQGTQYLVDVDQLRLCSSDSTKWKWYISAWPLKGSNTVKRRGIFICT